MLSASYASTVNALCESCASLSLGGSLLQRRTAAKRASKAQAWRNKRNPKFRGIRKQEGECVKAGTIIVRQVGKVFYPGQNIRLGRDYTLQATCEGFVRFYWDKKCGPKQESLGRNKIKRYCGLVLRPEDQLPRDIDRLGRARRFSLIDRNKISDYFNDRGPDSAPPAGPINVRFSDMEPPPTPFVRFTADDAVDHAEKSVERQPGPMDERDLQIANLMLKNTAVAADGLPKFSNIRRALGMPPKAINAASPIDRAIRRETRSLRADPADRDLVYAAVSAEEQETLVRQREAARSLAQ